MTGHLCGLPCWAKGCEIGGIKPPSVRVPPERIDPIDGILTESSRLAMLALEVLNGCREVPAEWPRPSVRAASLLRAAADLLGDLAG